MQMIWQGRVKAEHYHCGAGDQKTATGTNQATALPIKGDMIELTTVAASTGVALPQSDKGMRVIVINGGSNPVQVYTSPMDTGSPTIEGTPGATGVSQANGTRKEYYCPRAGVWYHN